MQGQMIEGSLEARVQCSYGGWASRFTVRQARTATKTTETSDMAIISFSDQDTESCFHDDKVSVKCSWASLKKKARQKLDYLNSVTYLEALRVPPSNHLELLKGDLAGFYSIRVNERWRIIFRWTPQGVEDVEVIDYHHG